MDLAKIRKKARQGTPAAPADAPPEVPAGGEKAKGKGKAEPPAPSPAPPPSPSPAAPPETPAEAREPEFEPAFLAQEPLPTPEQQERALRGDAAQAGPGERLLIFDAEGEKYAIPIHNISLIIEAGTITPIPNAPEFLLGILSLRGKIVSILDVALRLKLRRGAHPPPKKIIVLDMDTDHFGLLVNAIEQLVEVDLATLEPPPEGFAQLAEDFVEGVFHRKGKAVAFLNLPLFLSFKV